MSVFKGTLSASIQENHQFFSRHQLLQSMGLSSFTKTSCSIIYNKNRRLLDDPFFNSLQLSIPQNTTILDIGTGTVCNYTKFDKNTGLFDLTKTSITLADLYNLIAYHEDVQFFSTTTRQPQKDQQIIDINTSLEKCVVCETIILSTVLKIELRFQDRKNRSNERKIAFPNMVIAQPPSMPMGISYSQTSSSIHQSSSSSNIGSYIPNSQSNFTQDSVAAPLQMFYDSNTNKWKSGNVQMLARLLTDLDPAPIEPLDDSVNLNDAQAVISRTTLYTTGLALPLSIEQGNPYLFGPTFQQYAEKNIVKIPVVNRALRSFAKDTVVMLTEINGEWIVQDFGQTVDVKSPIKFGDWSFFKYIANTDSYFKGKGYYDTGDDIYLTDIKPAIYEQQSRNTFYTNILFSWSNHQSFIQDGIERPSLLQIYGSTLTTISNFNKISNSIVFEPSNNFYIGSIFDQLTPDVGGYSIAASIINYTNVADTAAFSDPFDVAGTFYKPRQFKTFWGPVYQDGFKTFSYNPNNIHNSNNPNLNIFFNYNLIIDDVKTSKPNYLTYFLHTLNNNIARQLFNMPAECGSIFINPLSIFQNWTSLGSPNFIINTPYIYSPYYGTSEPLSKNKIQFSPLYAEMIAESNSEILNRQNALKNEFGLNPSTSILGALFYRSVIFGSQLFTAQEKLNSFLSTKVKIEDDVTRTPNSLGGNAVRSYNPWKASLGVGSKWPNAYQGAFGVAVISAKQTISKRGGGDINFSTNQTFGRNTFDRIGGGVQTGTVVLGLGVGTVVAGFANQLAPANKSPTWGSRTDGISSFGTTALHVRIFDYWPEDQTIFDPRYFGVLHFNAGSYYGGGVLTTIIGESQINTQKRIDKAKSLDIPIPTLNLPQTDNPFDEQNDLLLNGAIVNKDTALKPKSQWKLNPIRRGVLLTGGGFTYLYHVIGLPNIGNGNFAQYNILSSGNGFTSTFEYSITSKNVKLKLTVSNGIISGVEFLKDNLDNLMKGDNFLPEDFNMPTPIIDQQTGNIIRYDEQNRGYILTIPSQTQGGKPAIIKFSNGIVWLKKAKDEAPKEQKETTRLSKSSQAGLANNTGLVSGGQDTVITLERNSSGQYDCFYHFHNDISHTLAYEYSAMPSWLQYVNLTIS